MQFGDSIWKDARWTRMFQTANDLTTVKCGATSRVTDIEYSALQMLIEGEQRTRKQGAIFWLADLNLGVLEGVRAAGLAEHMGHERMFHNARAAIAHYQTHYRSGPTREMTTDFPEA
jgi:hypothetical protein